jgi:hypothetical protein
LLALIRIPDFATPLGAMADSLARIAGRRRHTAAPEVEDAAVGAPDETVIAASEPPSDPANPKQAS